MQKGKSNLRDWLFGGGFVVVMSTCIALGTAYGSMKSDVNSLKKDVEKKASIEIAVKIQQDIESIRRTQEQILFKISECK